MQIRLAHIVNNDDRAQELARHFTVEVGQQAVARLFQPSRIAGDKLLRQIARNAQTALGNQAADFRLALQLDVRIAHVVDADAILVAVLVAVHLVEVGVIEDGIEV